MNSGIRFLSAAAASTLVLSLSPVSASAAPCASRADVRTQVAELVHSLRDDVRSSQARTDIAHALVEALRTFRGVSASTAAERRALRDQIAALVAQLHDAGSKVDRKALLVQIAALREQRERGAFTAEERAELRAAVTALRDAILERTDTSAEDHAVAAAVRRLQADFGCTG